MDYEYTTMVDTGSIDIAAAMSATAQDVSQAQGEGVNALLQKAVGAAADLAGGGWEIFSFDQLLVGDKIVTTFLLRRPRV